MRLGFIITLLLASIPLFAQDYVTKQNADKKAVKYYEKARQFNRAEDWSNALKQLDKALVESPNFIDALLAKAATLFQQGNYADAKVHYEKVMNLDPGYRPRAVYELAVTEERLQHYDNAADYFEQYITLEKRNEQLIKLAKKRLETARFTAVALKNPVPFEPQPLGDEVNSPAPEVLPALTADGEYLIFTRVVNNQEDFYISQKTKDGWGNTRALTGVNTPLNEGAQSISADGKFLVFTACNRKSGLGGCDLYYASVRNDRWTPAENMGKAINSGKWDSTPSISANGRVLYFASDRNGGQGGRDLWVSNLTAEGWSTPQNLGPKINSPGDEQSPFIHADGKTLYFMSNGHAGMGKFDLYFIRKGEDGTWGEPQNLGYPINTTANEGALIVSLDGKTAYFATDKKMGAKEREQVADLKGDSDIYQFELHAEARPQPATYLKAEVFDAETKAPLAAIVEINELPAGSTFMKVRADQEGQFLICIPAGQSYSLNVAAEGYLFHSENFDLTGKNDLHKPFLMRIGLTPIPPAEATAELPVAKPVILKNVFFETASASLKPASRTELDRLRDLLQENPSLRIQINGHTDNVGSDVDNQKLSEARAKAVYDYLIDQGIAAERLQFKGFGESAPIDTNDSEPGRRNNRRTEFVVLNNTPSR